MDVKVFGDITVYNELFTDISKSVDNVDKMHTCSHICLEKDLVNQVNSWTYDFNTRHCDCTWVDIDATLCIRNITLEPILEYKPQVWYNSKMAMLRLHDTIPCGKHFMIQLSYLDMLDVICLQIA